MTQKSFVNIWIESRGERWEHVRVHRLHGREAIGQLFFFDLEVATDPDHELPEGALPGEEATLVFEKDESEVRRVQGIFGLVRSRLSAADAPTYLLRLVPRAARLT